MISLDEEMKQINIVLSEYNYVSSTDRDINIILNKIDACTNKKKNNTNYSDYELESELNDSELNESEDQLFKSINISDEFNYLYDLNKLLWNKKNFLVNITLKKQNLQQILKINYNPLIELEIYYLDIYIIYYFQYLDYDEFIEEVIDFFCNVIYYEWTCDDTEFIQNIKYMFLSKKFINYIKLNSEFKYFKYYYHNIKFLSNLYDDDLEYFEDLEDLEDLENLEDLEDLDNLDKEMTNSFLDVKNYEKYILTNDSLIFYTDNNISGWFKKESLDLLKVYNYIDWLKLNKFLNYLFDDFMEDDSLINIYLDNINDYINNIEPNIFIILIKFFNIHENEIHFINWMTTFSGYIIFNILNIHYTKYELGKIFYIKLIKKIIDFSLILVDTKYGYIILESIINKMNLSESEDLEHLSLILLNLLDRIIDILSDEIIRLNNDDKLRGLENIINCSHKIYLFNIILDKIIVQKIHYDENQEYYELNYKLNNLIKIININIKHYLATNKLCTLVINTYNIQFIQKLLNWIYIVFPNLFHDTIPFIEHMICDSIDNLYSYRYNNEFIKIVIDFFIDNNYIEKIWLLLYKLIIRFTICSTDEYNCSILLYIIQKSNINKIFFDKLDKSKLEILKELIKIKIPYCTSNNYILKSLKIYLE